MPFALSEAHLQTLFEASNFVIPDGEMIFIGLRGCVPLDVSGTGFAGSHQVEYLGVDYLHLRCSLVQWKPGSGFAIFPGSTVPHLSSVQARIAHGGAGVNQLALGYYRGTHGYYRGDHKLDTPMRRHRAFRNDSVLPVWRTGDDADFEGDDRLDTTSVPGDNIHCAWQQNAAAATYSSLGCQVIVGRPRVVARGWADELGPWAKFVENAYGPSQSRFRYALFSGREVMALAGGTPKRHPTVRFGSEGELVEVVQDALIQNGYDVGQAGSDGDCGFGTITALRLFQTQKFGKTGVDLIVGPSTAQALGLAWPQIGGPVPPLIEPVAEPSGPSAPAPNPVTPGSAPAPAAAPNYRSLTPGGFFSSTPFDLSVKRSIRTNNPGALNISAWQRAFPGYVGQTQPDGAGNRTAIYVTPEHGIAAWFHLLTDRYGFGQNGSIQISDLARRYAGVPSATHPAARSYVAGWRRHSGNVLSGTSVVRLNNDPEMVTLAKGMFGHEIGAASPLSAAQVTNALALKRSGTLPPA